MYLKRVFLLLIVAVLLSCHQERKKSQDVLKFNISQGLSSLDPAFAKDLSTTWMVGNVYDCLFTLDENTELKPQLATHYEVNNDATLYTIYMQKGVFFHKNACFASKDSTRMATAYDAVYSLQRLLNPETASPGSWILNGKVDSLQPFKILDSFTFQIRLQKPFAQFIYILTMPYTSIVPHEAVSFYGSTFRKNPVGTGPYKMKDWEEGTALFLEKNPNYFQLDSQGVRLPYISHVKVTFNEQKKMEFLMLKKGELHFLKDVDGSVVHDVFDEQANLLPALQKDFYVQKKTYLNTEYLAIIHHNPKSPLHNKNVRKAINLAINRQEIVASLKNNLVNIANKGFVANGMPNYDTAFQGFEYNPAKAKELLAQAGYSASNKSKIQLHINNAYVDLAEFVIYQLQQVGFEVDLKMHPAETMMQLAKEGKIDFFRRSWTADYPDAESNFACFYSQNGAPPNYTRFKNKEYDLLYESILKEPSAEKRIPIYKKMEQILLEEAPIVPIFYDQSIRVIHKKVKNLGQNSINHLDLRKVRLEK